LSALVARRSRIATLRQAAAGVLVAIALLPASARAQAVGASSRYDDTFRKYSKRFFGVGFDWRIFKAQGMAESNLDPKAASRVGARGVMQLMPSTFREVKSRNPEMQRIDDAEWNIAAGVYYDRQLWQRWERDSIDAYRQELMLASYNAGRGTIHSAQSVARNEKFDDRAWTSIETVAPKVRRWRYGETLHYIRTIADNMGHFDDRGRLFRVQRGTPADTTRRILPPDTSRRVPR
jgi:membrane-bound lytic murein transglycosylase F